MTLTAPTRQPSMMIVSVFARLSRGEMAVTTLPQPMPSSARPITRYV